MNGVHGEDHGQKMLGIENPGSRRSGALILNFEAESIMGTGTIGSIDAEARDGNRCGSGGVRFLRNESDSDGSGKGIRDGEEEEEEVGEEGALMLNEAEQEGTQTEMIMDMNKSQAWNLYLSHFLSTWNGRSYEFAAIIFTANAWPDTLVAASIRYVTSQFVRLGGGDEIGGVYVASRDALILILGFDRGIVRTLASICLSSSVGRWVDRSPDRLKTLLTTITINRVAVICASILWFFAVESEDRSGDGFGTEDSTIRNSVKIALFVPILGLGILEGLSASGNMLSMERDWVVIAASLEGKEYDLTHLNATMRRIDLSCKLLAPILISFLISALGIKIGVIVVGGMSAASWGVEMWCARKVWRSNTRLQMRKDIRNDDLVSDVEVWSLMEKIARGFRLYREDFRNYFSSNVWVPSLSLSLLHLSALSYGATFITFLLNSGFSLDLITLARAAGSVVEISSTVVTPFGVRHLSKAHGHGRYDHLHRSDDSDEALLDQEGETDESDRVTTGLERLGLWGLSWQLINLIPVTLIIWSLSSIPSNPLPTLLTRITPTTSIFFPLFLFTALSFSRLGLWIFDLTTQQLTQTLVSPTHRSSFTGCEYSLVAFFELGNNLMAMIWSRPEQFKWVALVSLGAVGGSAGLYAMWVRSVRGHLVHWDRVGRCAGKCGGG